MPWYRINGTMVHLHFGNRRKAATPACGFRLFARARYPDGSRDERREVRCMQLAPFLCDWPGCDVPICEDHRLALGENVDLCPTHNARRGLFSRLLPAPLEASHG